MQERDKLTLLLTEVGSLTDADWVIRNQELDEWVIKLNDLPAVFINFNDAFKKVTFSIINGEIDLNESALRLLFNYNSLITESGGVRFSFSEKNVSMLLDVGINALNIELMVSVIPNLSDLAIKWEAMLREGQTHDTYKSQDYLLHADDHLRP